MIITYDILYICLVPNLFVLHPHFVGGDVKLQFLVKPNLTHNLVFTKYNRVYYIITLSEVLTYNETTVPEFCHNFP